MATGPLARPIVWRTSLRRAPAPAMNRSDHDQTPAGVRARYRHGTASTFHSRRSGGSSLSVFRMRAAMASTFAATLFLTFAGIVRAPRFEQFRRALIPEAIAKGNPGGNQEAINLGLPRPEQTSQQLTRTRNRLGHPAVTGQDWRIEDRAWREQLGPRKTTPTRLKVRCSTAELRAHSR